METILGASLLYILVFGAEYLRFRHQKAQYAYVSRVTFGLFWLGLLATIIMFWPVFSLYFDQIWLELAFLGFLAVILWLKAVILSRERLLVCHIHTRTERCLTPGYILVKGSEVLFHQAILVVLAVALSQLLGVGLTAYIALITVALLLHIPVVLGTTKRAFWFLSSGAVLISCSTLFVVTTTVVLWPAVYVHALLYVFYWLLYGDFEARPN